MTDHESWRKARAEECRTRWPDLYNATPGDFELEFLKGMVAEHEVAKLMGRITGLRFCRQLCRDEFKSSYDDELQKLESKLKALLAGELVEG